MAPAFGAVFSAGQTLTVAVEGPDAEDGTAPDPSNPLGKMLRFNDDGSIPSDNPHFATQTGLARAIWARGLRNPFTFAVQPGTGRIHINDVSQGTWEEINLANGNAAYAFGSVSASPVDLLATQDGALRMLRRNGIVRFAPP